MMCLLLKGHYEASPLSGEKTVLNILRSIPVETSWYGIYQAERKIGYGELTAAADISGEELLYRIYLFVNLALPEEITSSAEIGLYEGGGVTNFSFDVRTEKQLIYLSGRRMGNSFVIGYDFGGYSAFYHSDIPTVLSPPSGSVSLPIDEAPQIVGSVSGGEEEVITLHGVFTAARRHLLSYGNLRAVLWSADDGALLRLELPRELTVVREPKSLAMKADKSKGGSK